MADLPELRIAHDHTWLVSLKALEPFKDRTSPRMAEQNASSRPSSPAPFAAPARWAPAHARCTALPDLTAHIVGKTNKFLLLFCMFFFVVVLFCFVCVLCKAKSQTKNNCRTTDKATPPKRVCVWVGVLTQVRNTKRERCTTPKRHHCKHCKTKAPQKKWEKERHVHESLPET